MRGNLGRRLRFFRMRANLTQMELELEADMSMGSISRIESNQINATKETILKLTDILELSDEEIDYLIGRSAVPATAEEIEKAKIEAAEFLGKRGKLAYLLDDRWRFYMISDTFLKLLKVKPEELAYVTGKTTAQTIVRSDSPVIDRLDKENYRKLLEVYLPNYFANMSHMVDDEIYRATVRDVMSNPEAREIWTKLTYENDKKYVPQENRVIDFDLWGIKFPLYYSMLPLARNSRFVMVEFRTQNMLLDAIPYLI